MSKNREQSAQHKIADVDTFRPPLNHRSPILRNGGKPDSRLVSLVKLLARHAANEHFEAECAAENETKDKETTN